jgi:hypothetical protein
MTHPTTTWDEVERAFVNQFSEIYSEGQVAATLRYAKQKKYESVKKYYDNFFKLCAIIPQPLYDIYLRESFKKIEN